MLRHLFLIPVALLAAALFSSMARADEPAWRLKGSRIIGCCCTSPCPCRINRKPFHCHGCDFSAAIHIDHGNIGSVRMDGMTWVLTGRVFGEDPAKNWSCCYVTDAATDEQVKALQAMLEDQVKSVGTKAPYLFGTFHGVRKTRIDYVVSEDRHEYDVTIPGVLEFHTRAMVLPGRKEPVVTTGILDDFGDRFVHADCVKHKYEDKEIGYSWDLTGRQANQAEFDLTSDRVALGGIGWGCWSAHSELGDEEPYPEQQGGDDKK